MRKNYHVFEANDGSSWLETKPLLPHTVTKINLTFEKGIDSLWTWDLFPNTTLRGRTRRRIFSSNSTFYNDYRTRNKKESFRGGILANKTSNTLQSGTTKYRGTACCIDLYLDTDQGQQELHVKVGVGHTVTKDRDYLSFFYAFLPYPPFLNVGYSGYFCLGGMTESDEGYSRHWISKHRGVFNESIRTFLGETYHCPKVTFASSGIWQKWLGMKTM